MSDNDKFLIRGNDQEGFINMRVGEPYFMRKHLHFPPGTLALTAKDYPAYRGSRELLEELGWMYPGKYVVVANGAKQALLAAFYAYKKYGKRAVYHEAPFWLSYPTLAELSGLSFNNSDVYLLTGHSDLYVTVTTAPNNPDGRIKDHCPLSHYDIWDAAYADPVYGWDPSNLPSHEVSVWSAAKLFGQSGDRVGWLVTGNKAIADAAADYVEKTTSGVSTRSQGVIAKILQYNRFHKSEVDEWYEDARYDLIENAMTMVQHLYGYCTYMYPENPAGVTGMFGWFKVKGDLIDKFDSILNEAKVSLVPGKACGMAEAGWYRMSLGQTPEVTKAALSSISQGLYKRTDYGSI